MATATESALLRAEQAYVGQLADSESLDRGIAFIGRRHKALIDANQFREVFIEDAGEIPTVFDAVEKYFAERDSKCRVWAPAADAPIEPLEEFLCLRGFESQCYQALCVSEWVDVSVPDGVRILPARAMRKALDSIMQSNESEPANDGALTTAAAFSDRLDDPRTDAWVAMSEKRCVGYGAIFQIGDVARLGNIFVVDDERGRGIGTALIGQMLRLARRLMIRLTGVRVPVNDERTANWLRRCGFAPDGTIKEFVRTA